MNTPISLPEEPEIPQVVPPNIKPSLRPSLREQMIIILQKINLHSKDNYERYVRKIVSVMLIVQGLLGIYQSIHFILAELPILNNALELHSIDQNDINNFASQAVIIIVSTFINLLVAVRLSSHKDSKAKHLQTAMGIILFVGNAALMKYINGLRPTVLIEQTLNIIVQ